jgi:hypothetical protein
MEIFLSNITIGIISGIVTAILIWFFVLVFNGLIKPYISEILYRGVDLEGEWHADCFIERTVGSGSEKKTERIKHKEFTISIKQSAYVVRGDMIVKNINGREESFSFYQYTGVIRDNFVVLNYTPKSKKNIGMGSIFLIVRNGGKGLEGNLIGTNINDMTLMSLNKISFLRK